MNDYRVTIEKAAALEGISYNAIKKRLKCAHVILINDPDDSRRKLVPLAALSGKAQQAWLKDAALATHFSSGSGTEQLSRTPAPYGAGPTTNPLETSPANNIQGNPSTLALAPYGAGLAQLPPMNDRHCSLQPSLAFRPAIAPDGAWPAPALAPYGAGSANGAAAAVPEKYSKLLERRLQIVAQCVNHDWKKYEGEIVAGYMVQNGHDYICAQAKLQGRGFSVSQIYEMLKVARAVMAEKSIPPERKWSAIAEGLLPKPRPGRSGHHFFTELKNAWQWPFARNIYLNQACLSIRRTHELLLEEIEARERAADGEALYERPTVYQLRTALEKIPEAERLLGRGGDKIYADRAAPYISRRPPQYSGVIVSTDQKCLDILVRDNAWRLGRIWTVNFIDVASERWLGGAFAPYLSGDVVMEAAALMLERACVPGATQMDLGKEFVGKRFLGGLFRISGEALFAEALGLWERLGVTVVKAIGGNPKTKPIEHWHRSLRSFEQSWATWTGGSTDERPPRLALMEKQAADFKKGQAPPPPVPSIEQVITAFFNWCELEWNAKHRGRGKYRQGMTPDEAWFVKRPPDGWRTLTPDEVKHYTADRRYLKVARGGQINLTIYGQTIEYCAPELLLLKIGKEEVEVVIDRQSLGEVRVIYGVPGGTAQCTARMKGELAWGEESREEIRMRLRCMASLKRALKRGQAAVDSARQLLPEAPFLSGEVLARELERKKLVGARQLFGTAASGLGGLAPNGHNEISGAQHVANRRRTMTSSDLARELLEIEEEGQ